MKFFQSLFLAILFSFLIVLPAKTQTITIESGNYNYYYYLTGSSSTGSINFNLNGQGLSVEASSNPTNYFGPIRGTGVFAGSIPETIYDFTQSSFDFILNNPNAPLGNEWLSRNRLRKFGARVIGRDLIITTPVTLNGTVRASLTGNMILEQTVRGTGIATFRYTQVPPPYLPGNFYLTQKNFSFNSDNPTTNKIEK